MQASGAASARDRTAVLDDSASRSEAAERHVVQFYEDDDFLCETVADYLREGVGLGEPVLVIAAEPHIDGTSTHLRAMGVDVARLSHSGRLLCIDAEQMLSTFMVGGMPDPRRFRDAVGGALDALRSRGGCTSVRAYGEMVDLLWRDGNREAALRLEALWNDIAQAHPLSLLCAYRMDNFASSRDAGPLVKVCASHARALPTESYASLDAEQRLREIACLQQRARALETEIARRERVERALMEAVRARDEFLSIAGHELRTPLTVLQLQLESLEARMDGGDAGLFERLGKAARSATRLGTLVNDLLDVSRIGSGRLMVERQPMDLVTVVHDAVERVAEAAARAECRVRVLAPESMPGVWDQPRIEQVVGNLISNAIKYGPGAPIEVIVEGCERTALLAVRDHGIGIALDDQARVFERFERAASPLNFGGLGLGLWIVKQVVEAHEGSIRLDSELGQGSTFTVRLPRA
jgi:signal transduction histidine kinase